MRIYKEIPKLAHEIAHKYCDGRWIAVGGGGYDIWRVVPRAWSLIWLEMTENMNNLWSTSVKIGLNEWQRNLQLNYQQNGMTQRIFIPNPSKSRDY